MLWAKKRENNYASVHWQWNEADVWISRPTSWAEPSSLALNYPPCSPQLRPSSWPAPSSSTSTTENTHLTARFSLSFLKSKHVCSTRNSHKCIQHSLSFHHSSAFQTSALKLWISISVKDVYCLTRLFLRALASATRLTGRALISRHFCLYSSTISLVTGTGLLRCFFSSSTNHAGISVISSEFANLRSTKTMLLPQKRTNNVIKSLAQSDLWKEPLIRSRARFLDVAIWAPSAKPSASRIRARLSAKKKV